jgi:hypothetical protein
MPAVLLQTHPRFITNSKGQRKAVILPIREYDELLEDLKDLATVAERHDEPTISHEIMVAELVRDGYLAH